MEEKFIIYTDGSCLGNPGPGGWAAVIIHNEQEFEICGHHADTTNNRMEMTAIIEALNFLHQNFKNKLQEAKIEIHSDSNLIIQTINQGWKRKANTDLWAEMDSARAWLNISWNWVKGHNNHKYNEMVDKMAVEEAKKVATQ